MKHEPAQLLTRHMWTGCVLGALALTAGASRAEPMRVPLPVTTAELETITFARLVVRAPQVQGLKLVPDAYRVYFLEHLRKLGYPAVGAESLVFDRDLSSKARHAIGGSITQVECAYTYGSPSRRCQMTVDWELLDRSDERVVYRVTTRHAASGLDDTQMANELVWGTFLSLLSRPRFVTALRKTSPVPAGPPPAKATYQRCKGSSLTMPGASAEVLKATALVTSGAHLGSGVLVSPDGLVLTAAHVVSPSEKTQVQPQAGNPIAATVIRMDLVDDVALLRMQTSEPTACLELRAEPARVGEDVYAIGSPLGKTLAFSLTRGIVSAVRSIDGKSLVQTDATVNQGNSGGPLIDGAGKAIGIVSWKAVGRGVEGIGFGVPIPTALEGLGLVAGDATDAALTRAMQAPAVSSNTEADQPDPPVSLAGGQTPSTFPPPPQYADTPPPPRRSTASYALLTAGWILAGAGTVGALTTLSAYRSTMSEDEYRRLRAANDASWGAGGVGLAFVAIGYALPWKRTLPSAPRKSALDQVHISASARSIAVGYEF